METAGKSVRIGLKLRHARRTKGLTLMELAQRVGCSESLLSKIENDKVRPSVRVLHHLVAALDTNVSVLFQEDGVDADVVLHPGERPRIHANARLHGNGVEIENLVPSPGSRLLQATLQIIGPGGGTDGTIEHAGEEVGYVLEGSVELIVGDRSFVLGPGDSFCFRSDQPHGYRNTSDTVARVLWVSTPPTF